MSTSNYITIPLSKTGKYAGQYEAIISVEDSDLAELNWSVVLHSNTQYAQRHRRNETPKSQFLHRVIMSRILDKPIKDVSGIDHIDGNGLNNRRDNLRTATQSQNLMNRIGNSNATSKYKGVSRYRDGKRWQAFIGLNGKSIYLGIFNTELEAYKAYCDKACELFGKFANFGE